MRFWNEQILLQLFIAIACISNSIHGYKFLGVLHFSSKSHFIVGSALLKGLAQKGHEVTVISPFPQKKPPPNYYDVPTPSVLKIMEKEIDNLLDNTERSLVENIVSFHNTGVEVTEAVLNEPAVKKLMATNQTFDAVICEVFLSEALYGLSEHFKAPLIGLGTFGAISWNTDMVGSPSPPSYVANTFLPFTDHMSLGQRIINLAMLTFERLFLDLYYLPKQEEVFRKYFPNSERSMCEIRKNAALVLLNTHFSLSFPRPYVPNQIEVGGMHINRKRTPLPQDIEQFINGSQHGVIYFSMGSNIKSANLPLEKRQEIMKALKSVKQRVLWKFEDPNLEGKPDNVFISDWFPQDDILAHDNVKLFITHGGLLSTTESIYHGKPFIGIPIFGDQFLNMAKAVANGYGIMLDYKNITATAMQHAIETMISDPKYTQLVRAMSQRYRDQPMEPLAKAIFWVEHVARHKGAKYLHCAGLDLNFIQYHSIDAIVILSYYCCEYFAGCVMRFKMLSSYLFLLIGLFTIANNGIGAYKYLGVIHTAAKSHFIVGSSLMKALAEKGHEVYVISPFPQKTPIKNYHDIPVTSILTVMGDEMDNLFKHNERSMMENIVNYYEMGINITEVVLQEPSVQELLASNHTFDAVICEVFLSEALFGFSEHFNAPLIGLGTFGAASWNTDMVGSPSPPSYVPGIGLKFSNYMTLTERVGNLAFVTFDRLFMDFYYLPKQAALYDKYFPQAKRNMYEVRKNTALVLLNTHVSLAFSRPYVPNQIEVGGMHINRKSKPLPEDIAKFINEAEHGVIYFSMGSNLKSKNMPQAKKDEILNAFRKLKQRVLWKFEDSELEGKPENVLIRDWFPQDDILAHKNVKVFITHGGLLSTTESIYHRTPVIGIPIFGDQFLNMGNAEKQGYGLMLDYQTLTADKLSHALNRMLTDPSFQQRVNEISDRYRDQEMLPMEKAIFWVEHVVRQKGAKYMHCAGLDLSFIEYHNIDAMLILYGGILFTLCCFVYFVYLIIKGFVKSFVASKPKRSKQKKN
ncbi:uncharacterized protein LOC133328353 [Musca vetustissima]|uniref:uncharacterized protein LOC133328353 n=1 Tax=Musca vetustissima TaxID=27455 RepID=UPI002AB6EBC5|nr:uncharacterized protein LOC133328353 [Musca vetustissima]